MRDTQNNICRELSEWDANSQIFKSANTQVKTTPVSSWDFHYFLQQMSTRIFNIDIAFVLLWDREDSSSAGVNAYLMREIWMNHRVASNFTKVRWRQLPNLGGYRVLLNKRLLCQVNLHPKLLLDPFNIRLLTWTYISWIFLLTLIESEDLACLKCAFAERSWQLFKLEYWSSFLHPFE